MGGGGTSTAEITQEQYDKIADVQQTKINRLDFFLAPDGVDVDFMGIWQASRYKFEVNVLADGRYDGKFKGLEVGNYFAYVYANAEGGYWAFEHIKIPVSVVVGQARKLEVVLRQTGSMLVPFKLPVSAGSFEEGREYQVIMQSAEPEFSTNNWARYENGNLYFQLWAYKPYKTGGQIEISVKDKVEDIINFKVPVNIMNYVATNGDPITLNPMVSQTGGIDVDIKFAHEVGYTVALDRAALEIGVKATVAGSTRNGMLALKITTKGHPYGMQKLELNSYSSNPYNNGVAWVEVYDGAVLVGNGVLFHDRNSMFIFNSVLSIPANSVKILMVKVDFQSFPNTNAGDAVRINYVSSSGVLLDTAEVVEDRNPLDGQVTAYLYRSVPRVTIMPLPDSTLRNGTNVLYRAKVEADANGDIDWFRQTYKFSKTNGVTLANLRIVDEVNDWALAVTDNNSAGEYGFNFPDAFTIGPGSFKIFALKAEVSGAVPGSHIATQMVGDEQQYKNLPAAQASDPRFTGETNNNFVWTDKRSYTHSLTTEDWHNGKGVSLPTDGIMLAN